MVPIIRNLSNNEITNRKLRNRELRNRELRNRDLRNRDLIYIIQVAYQQGASSARKQGA